MIGRRGQSGGGGIPDSALTNACADRLIASPREALPGPQRRRRGRRQIQFVLLMRGATTARRRYAFQRTREERESETTEHEKLAELGRDRK